MAAVGVKGLIKIIILPY